MMHVEPSLTWHNCAQGSNERPNTDVVHGTYYFDGTHRQGLLPRDLRCDVGVPLSELHERRRASPRTIAHRSGRSRSA